LRRNLLSAGILDSLKGRSAFVWVLTSLRPVVYIYSDSREGETIQKLLAGFKGVLVTDFYTAYDSIECPQQRCLIHLVRDLNEEILGNPFDEELKRVVSAFGELLRRIVGTVDRHGLRSRFLGRHLVEVERFYRLIGGVDCQTEAAAKCVQRFERNRDKLFTFIQYDGVTWNNNNAENAIKRFAYYRQDTAGTMGEAGLDAFLVQLSISCTCRNKGVSFLKFLLSRDRDMDRFCAGKRSRRRPPLIELYPKGFVTPLARLAKPKASQQAPAVDPPAAQEGSARIH
jgi:hypothetical protein